MDRDVFRQAAALGSEGSPVKIDGVPLHRVELRKLRHAAVLAFEGNFARAAAKLHITPSALSQSIAKLEDDLGLVLFDRHKTGATLSQVGRQFIGRIDKLLSDARGLARDLALASGADVGDVCFGIRPNAARMVLSELLAQLAVEAPKLQVKVAITLNEVMVEYMLLEGIEFVIADASVAPSNERLTTRRIASVPTGLYVRRDHPLAGRSDVTMAELRQYPTAALNMTDQHQAAVRAWLGLAEGEPFPGYLWCDDYAYLLEAVMGGDYVLMAPAQSVSRELAAGQIRRIAPRDEGPAYACELYLITLANRSLAPPARMIIEKLEALMAAKLTVPPTEQR
jgi:DNA-binding transcriptional LysR family regulator